MTDSGSMTNPSEAMIEAGAMALRDVLLCDPDWARKQVRAIYRAMQQAATPAAPCKHEGRYDDPNTCMLCGQTIRRTAAPVQDDDAELIEELQIAAQEMRDLPRDKKNEMEMLTGFSADALAHLYGKCSARLTPDRVTPLVEALRAIVSMKPRTTAQDHWFVKGRDALRDGGFDA